MNDRQRNAITNVLTEPTLEAMAKVRFIEPAGFGLSRCLILAIDR